MPYCTYNRCRGVWHTQQHTVDKHKQQEMQKKEFEMRATDINNAFIQQYFNSINNSNESTVDVDHDTEGNSNDENNNIITDDVTDVGCDGTNNDNLNDANDSTNNDSNTTNINDIQEQHYIDDLNIDEVALNTNMPPIFEKLIYLKYKNQLTHTAMEDICNLYNTELNNNNNGDRGSDSSIDNRINDAVFPNTWSEVQDTLDIIKPKHIKVNNHRPCIHN